MKQRLNILWLILLLTTLALALSACSGGSTSQPAQQATVTTAPTAAPTEDISAYEFVFKGTSSDFAGGRTLNISVYGLKDDNHSLELRVAEYPQILIEGHYEYVEGKGYKVYFADASSSYVYSQFDPDTKTLNIKYTLDMGSLGSARLSLDYVSDAFAAIYDGEGLGRTPPTFYGVVSGVGAADCTLVCNEDGTFTTAAVENRWNGGRTGTWEYDEANDQYLFHFNPDTNYNLAFEGNEADGEGRYRGYNRVDDGTTSNERQFVYSTAADPVCFELPITQESFLPINEPYKSAASYDEETGRVDIRVTSLDNLEELATALIRGNDYTFYKDLPDVYYYVMEDGSLNFLPECVSVVNESGTYDLVWSVTSGKYGMATGNYDPNY